MRKTGVTIDEVFERIYKKVPTSGAYPDGQILIGFSIGGVQLPPNDIKTIKAEAGLILNTMLWKLLLKRGYFSAQIKGVDNSKDFGDVREARGMVSALALINNELEILKEFVEPIKSK